ncbi:MAG: single-stranded DNA-binding protein [Candidatus Omnitrophica bacterium]|nr:single-stranded DNA-binding protein [Candidatus Omnitrophota bacterium]
MASLNKVFLMGNLTRDPELRYVPSGTAVASFGLAMNRTYTTQTGEKKEEVCFVTVVVWGKQAESCSQYLNKGSQVLVEGRLSSRSWEQEGQKRSVLEVRAERVQFLGRQKAGTVEGLKEEAEEEVTTESPSKGGGVTTEEVPF